MTPRPHLPIRPLALLFLACVGLFVAIAGHQAGLAQGSALQLLSRDGRRTLPVVNAGNQEMVLLDELANAFQLAVRDDAGGITVGYKGRSVVLTPDQTIASVGGRLISLPAPPTRVGGRWAVPLDFIPRALAPIYDTRLELRRTARLLLIGDVRVPRVSVAYDALGAGSRVTVEVAPSAATAVTQQGTQRLLVRIDADAIDATIAGFAPSPFVQGVQVVDATTLAVELGPRFVSYRSTTQPADAASRLVLDIVGAQTEVAPAPAVPAAPAGALPRDLALGAIAPLRTIVIDPGHGGTDTGAKGAGGTEEKDVVLAIARRVRGAIESRLGVRVVMTREDDREVALPERVALANNNKADLFISLHANASFRPELTGATVYVAAFSQAETAAEGLAPERLPVFGGGLRDIEVVPWNLAQTRHLQRSIEFATLVSEAFGSRVPVAARPLDRAPLRVLEPANMPAVLIEAGYLTNTAQEQALADSELHASIAQAVLDAIVTFRDRLAAAEDAAR